MFHTGVMTARNSGFATSTQAIREGIRRARGATSQTRFGAGSAEPGRNG
jgi:hypothetical protein